MTYHQIHFGRKFYLDTHKGYWNSTDAPRIFAHRWVWINHFGKIPKGCHIHHVDEDKSNNSIENLQLMTASQHFRHHGKDPARKEAARKTCDKIRPLTKEWHRSKEGRDWHKAHGILTWLERKEIKIKCKQCKETCTTKTYHQDFCSNKCKSKWRRNKGVDDIDRNCTICSKIFKSNRYKKSQTCGLSCGAKLRWINNKKTIPLP